MASNSAKDLGLYNDDTDLFSAYNARSQPGADQSKLGPTEHGQFAEYAVGQNKAMALPLAVAIPDYTIGKAIAEHTKIGGLAAALLGLRDKNTSPASMEEMKQAYKGVWRGLTK